MKLMIYMPAFNEAESIQQVIANLPRSLEGIDNIQCLVVDDGSTDQTTSHALSAGAKVVNHNQERGVGAASQSAVQFALEHNVDLLVGVDADRQSDIKEIPNLIQPLLHSQADMIVANCINRSMSHSEIGVSRTPKSEHAAQ